MTNTEIIQTIKTEIGKHLDALNKVKHLATFSEELGYNHGFEDAMRDLLSFLSTLEEAAEKYAYGGMPDEMKPYVKPVGDEVIKNFIAGAKWDRQQMMKEAVGVQVVGEQRDLRLIDSTQRCLFNANRGDWLKIIIVKEDEK